MKARSFSIIVITAALALLGCALITRLPVKLMPSRTMPSMTVSYSMPHAAARVVESEVTSKLESVLARIQGIKEIESESSNGSGRITLTLDEHTDMQQARFEASSIVRQVWPQLPEGVSYPIVEPRRAISQATRPVLSYTITASETPPEIMEYAEEYVRPVLGRVAGVNKVIMSGATQMEWRLTYDSNQLRALGLTPYGLQKAIIEQSRTEYLGMGHTSDREWLSVSSAISDDGDFDFADITVALPDSSIISLDRLITARYMEAEPTSYYRVNGLNSIYCNIFADEEANQLEVAAEVKRTLDSMNLPEGYSFRLSYDATANISAELDKIYFRTGLTLLILLAFVALITLNLRYMLVITISLLANLAIAVIFYYLFRLEIQLYSLAGITISLNLIIDNIIVMSDHLIHKRNLKAFTAVLAATLTTIGALGIVFFLDDELRLNLQDFVAVVIINLCVSLAIALFLVPALIERIGVGRHITRKSRLRVKFIRLFDRGYGASIRFGLRWKWAFIVIAILAFGIPVFMLPKEIKGCDIYNKTIGSQAYQESVKPWIDKALGGTLRLFVKDVYEGSYFNRGESEPTLYISATLPNGSTLEQMYELVKKMEAFISGFDEVKQFRTNIMSARRASLDVSFKPEAAFTSFPYQLKSKIISKAITLGGGSWSVYGLQDQGFSNSVVESSGSYRVKLTGYNYDELERIAEAFRDTLLTHRRIKEVTVSSEFSWYKDDYTEFYLDIDRDAMAREHVSIHELFNALQPVFGRDINCGLIPGSTDRIYLESRQSSEYDVWSLMNIPFTLPGTGKDKNDLRVFKTSDFASLGHTNAPSTVAKENQQYRLCLQYEYVGSSKQGDRVLNADIEKFKPLLPLGYNIENKSREYNWNNSSSTNYWLLLLVMAIIFWVTAILFNSLRQPLVIIFTIPISFIGVFLIFYLTKMNFDQGGFASFVLLCGITVNAAIYLLNEYNRLRSLKPKAGPVKLYLKAWNAKIIPILLTVVSTVLGFIPFMVGTNGKEGFWFPLALGTIGGLIMSLLALLIYLPIFVLPATRRKDGKKKKPGKGRRWWRRKRPAAIPLQV